MVWDITRSPRYGRLLTKQDASSPLPPTAELDKRHLLARQRKSSQLASYWKRSEAMRARSEIVGGVRGFPKEWLQAKSQ